MKTKTTVDYCTVSLYTWNSVNHVSCPSEWKRHGFMVVDFLFSPISFFFFFYTFPMNSTRWIHPFAFIFRFPSPFICPIIIIYIEYTEIASYSVATTMCNKYNYNYSNFIHLFITLHIIIKVFLNFSFKNDHILSSQTEINFIPWKIRLIL